MKKQRLLIIVKVILIFLCIAVAGCRNFCFLKLFRMDMSCGCSNYVLDNGRVLPGNEEYTAVSYSGYRTDTRTAGDCPTVKELKEDMQILAAMGIKLIRTYNTQAFPQTARMLEAIRELKEENPDFEMYVMVGAWIQCRGAYSPSPDHSQGDYDWNKREIDTAIEFAHIYPDIVRIIAVGNEAMVTWQAHFVPPSVILRWVRYLKEAETSGRMPADILITTSDNWAALGGQESYQKEDLLSLLREIDFLSVHTYAFHDTYYDPALNWAISADEVRLGVREQSAPAVERAVAHQIRQVEAVKQYLKDNKINKPIHIGETGWATLDNLHYGQKGTCAADEYKAKLFYDAVREWTRDGNMTCFYFEAFDEPWKSGGTAGSEGHFGLFTVDGRAKCMIWDWVDQGVFQGLTRGGNPIVKTYGGFETDLMTHVKSPAYLKFKP